MRNRLVLTALFTAAAGCLAACDPATGSAARTPSAAPASSTVPSAPATPTASASPDGKVTADAKATVPDFVGMGLQAAQDKAQENGFYGLTSHDSLGRDRMQAFDRNWKVCSQNVKAGTSASTGTTLDFGSVKLDETCPTREQAAPTAAGGKMPDFRGKSVKAARAALDSGTSITVNDASAEDRWVLMESNWKVCTQNPAAGTALKGQPVTFTAVKFGEDCT
ncbi:PASTA domain-containing protein [Streptomyces bobili]|uniref:PASTA domain-containing protein n=1 Tax=Streptomyces bobili TaxID=67280 RepID=UPI0033A5C6E5